MFKIDFQNPYNCTGMPTELSEECDCKHPQRYLLHSWHVSIAVNFFIINEYEALISILDQNMFMHFSKCFGGLKDPHVPLSLFQCPWGIPDNLQNSEGHHEWEESESWLPTSISHHSKAPWDLVGHHDYTSRYPQVKYVNENFDQENLTWTKDLLNPAPLFLI